MSYPILFAPGTTDFSGLGIGVLTDTIECRVREVLNGEYELSMTYPVEGEYIHNICKEAIIAVKLRDRQDYQAFRVFSISKPLDKNITLAAEHISYKLAEIPLKNFSAGGIHEVLAAFTNHVVDGVPQPFTFTTNFINSSAPELITDIPVTIKDVMGDDDGMILSKDEWKNGEWKFDNWNISFLQNRGVDKSSSIVYQYGSNVSNFNQDEDLSNTVTAVFPYWHTSYTDPNSESGAQVPVNVYGSICYAEGHEAFANERISIVDVDSYFTDEEKEQWEPDAAGVKHPTVAEVTAKGEEALSKEDDICKPHVSLTIDPVELSSLVEYADLSPEFEQVNLGDTVGVYFSDYDISTSEKIIEIEYDVLHEVNTKIVIGDTTPNLASTIADIGKAIEENRAGMSVTRDSLLLYVKHEAGDLATQISMTEDEIYQRVSGNPSGWNMVPITGDTTATGGEGIDISFYNYGDPDEHYEAGAVYNNQYYFDDETGAVWKCVLQSGEYVWIRPTWTRDHGKVASGTTAQMNAAANYDHWMFSWYNTDDDTIYTCERYANSSAPDGYTYYWMEKEDQHIQLTGYEMYAERADIYAYSEIKSSANQIVLKVNSGGKMVLVELGARAGLGSEFNVRADNINFAGHTFNLSTDNMTIVSDTTVIDEDGYTVYYLCNSTDVGAVPLAGGLYYNKKIVMAFQDGDAGWSLEDRSMNAFSELRGNNFIIEQLYDKTDWTPINDTYLNDQASFPGKTKAYLSMNPRWFGMYHKNDQLSDTQKFDYRLGHFLQNGEVSETVGKIDQWWSGDSNPQNPDEAMFLMEKPDESSESFAMMVYDQIIMAGGKYTSKQSPRMFRIRSKIDPNTNTVMRYNQFGVSDYFYKKAPYQINGKPMYTLTHDASSISAGDDLEDGCFVIVYDGPEREKELISVTLYGGMGDTITIKDEDNQLIATVVFATGAGSSVYQSRDLDKFSTYRFTSSIYSYTVEHTIETASDTVEVIPDSVKWLRVADFPVATVGDATDDTVRIVKRGIWYKGKIYAAGAPYRRGADSGYPGRVTIPIYCFDGSTWYLSTELQAAAKSISTVYFYTAEITMCIYNDKLRVFFGDMNNNYYIYFNMYVFDGTTWERREKGYYGNYFPQVRMATEIDGLLYMIGNGGIFVYNDATEILSSVSSLPFDNGQYQGNNNWNAVMCNGVCHLFYRYQKYYNAYPYRHVILDLETGTIETVLENEIWTNRPVSLAQYSTMIEYDGKILNVNYQASTAAASVEMYNPANGSWSYFPDEMPYAAPMAPSLVANGKNLYLIGDNYTNLSGNQSLENVYKYRG